jgi:hypothetical protein
MTSDPHVDDINEDLSDEDETIKPVLEEIKKDVKPKRVMSEKQLENLKKAREIAKIKLNEKRKETADNKKKEAELKLLKKLEKTQTMDKELDDLKEKIIKPDKPDKPEPEQEVIPKLDDDIIYIKKTKSKPKKKVIYISESDSDDQEVVYKKKRKSNKKPSLEDLTIKDVEKNESDELLKNQYNDKLSLIKKEFIMNQVFPK